MIRKKLVNFTDFYKKLDNLKESIKSEDLLVAAYLFGSCARGDFKPLSDIDIGILFKEDTPLNTQNDVETRVLINAMKIFKTEEIDLIILNNAPLHIQYEVIKPGKVIFSANNELRADFETRVIMEYLDFVHIREEFYRETLRLL